MCIIFLAVNEHRDYPLILLANRDEFQERPALNAHFWKEHPELLGGKDLKEGGTWLGLTKNGRISAITNHRDIPLHKEGRHSRGLLVLDYLLSETSPSLYLEELVQNRENYNPFNLLVGSVKELFVYSNISNKIDRIEKGLHGISNAFLNTPWPKITRGLDKFKSAIEKDSIKTEELFSIMQDTAKAPDHLLPDTGVGLEKERFLSSIFLQSEVYGTRSTAVLLFDRNNTINFFEKSYSPGGTVTDEQSFKIELNS